MEVRVVSREMIKPSSSPTIQTKEPYKLCLFDQLIPLTYMSIVLFYPKISNNDTAKTLTHLKKSLSEILNLYYPFSGRTKNNLFVEDFDSGVPSTSACRSISSSKTSNRLTGLFPSSHCERRPRRASSGNLHFKRTCSRAARWRSALPSATR